MTYEIHGYARKAIEKALKAREDSHAAIAAGKQFPTIHLLYAGAPFIGGSLVRDIKIWSEKESLRAETLHDADTRSSLAEAMLNVSHEASADNLLALRALLLSFVSTDEAFNDYTYLLRRRLELYLSAYDDKDAHKYCATEALSMSANSQDDVSTRYLMMSATLFAARSERGVTKGALLDEEGSDLIHESKLAESLAVTIFGSFKRYDAAKAAAAKDDEAEKQAHIDAVKAASEPEKPEKDDDEDEQDENDGKPRMLVVPSIEHLIKSSKGIYDEFKGIQYEKLPLVEFDSPVGVYEDLCEIYPWAESAIESIVKDLGRSRVVKMKPVLFVGPPGCGKTALAMDLLRDLGVKPIKYSCAGVSDSAFAGTSRQWSNARASIPIQLIRRTGIANPGILLDEIEKVGTDRRNGNILDSLLELLERSSARNVFDLALEIPVDLSAVVWVATANSLEGLPSALRDRFRIVHVPAPRAEHIEALCRSILDDKAQTEDLRREWLPDLDADELDNLRRVWKGGSIRPLVAAVNATLSAREECSWKM